MSEHFPPPPALADLVERLSDLVDGGGAPAAVELVLDEMLGQFPTEPEAWFQLARASPAQHADDLRRRVVRAVTLADEEPWSLVRAAEVLGQAGHAHDALAWLDRVPDEILDGHGALRGRWLLTSGRAALDTGDRDRAARAETELRRMTDAHPDDPVGAVMLCGLLVHGRRLAEAREVVGRALRSQPEDDVLLGLLDALREIEGLDAAQVPSWRPGAGASSTGDGSVRTTYTADAEDLPGDGLASDP